MGFLDDPISQMSRDELIRLIKQVIQQEVPPIPAGLAGLDDSDLPIISPPVSTDGQLLAFQGDRGDWNAVDPTTSILGPDGAAPGSSPTPTVRGNIGSLVVQWTPVSNNDLVIYEVHLSTSSGFTPGAGTLVGETPGALAFIRKDAAGAALAYSTDYYVKIVATDDDGSAAASAETGPTQLDPAGSDDILANAITAEKLETVLSLASSMVAGTPGAARAEMGYGIDIDGNLDTGFIGIRAFDSSNDPTFRVDALTGNVFLAGSLGDTSIVGATLTWGSASSLNPDDTITIKTQAGGFATPAIVQSATNSRANTGIQSTATCAWDQATVAGNHLFLVLLTEGTTPTTPTGWTLLATKADPGSFVKVTVWYKAAAASRSGSETVSLSTTAQSYVMQLVEVSGLTGGLDKSTSLGNAGSTSLDTGTTAALTQAEEWAFAALGHYNNNAQTAPSYTAIENGTISDPSPALDMTLYSYYKSLSATTGEHATATIASSAAWAGIIGTFKRKALTPSAPSSGNVLTYAKNDGAKDRLAYMDSTGTEYLVGIEDTYVVVASPYTKGTSTVNERTLMESANNLPTTASLAVANEVGAVYRFSLTGYYNQGSAGGSLSFKVKIGSTVLDTRNVGAPASNQTNQGWTVEGWVVVKTTGATGTVNGGWTNNASGATTPLLGRALSATDITVDLTAGSRLDVTATYGNSNANNGITTDSVVVERIA